MTERASRKEFNTERVKFKSKSRASSSSDSIEFENKIKKTTSKRSSVYAQISSIDKSSSNKKSELKNLKESDM
jgi:hypothetical protein